MAELTTQDLQERTRMLKEAFAILTQGVEILHYDRKADLLKGHKTSKIVWLDTDILRLCVDTHRPTIEDRKSGKVPPGVYMRDVSDIRSGKNAFDFKSHSSSSSYLKSTEAPMDEFCLHIIATERTFCFEFPSEYVRNWFLVRFDLIMNDIHSVEENIERMNRWIPQCSIQTIEKDAEHLAGVFKRGMQIRHHDSSGHVNSAIVMISNNNTGSSSNKQPRITVYPTPSKSIFNWLISSTVPKPMGLDVSDIVEVRVGTHSFNFLATKSVGYKDDLCVSIIGTECTLDLEFTAPMPRDIFAEIMGNYLIHHHHHHQQQQGEQSSPPGAHSQQQQKYQQPYGQDNMSYYQTQQQQQDVDGYSSSNNYNNTINYNMNSNNNITDDDNIMIMTNQYRRRSLNESQNSTSSFGEPAINTAAGDGNNIVNDDDDDGFSKNDQ